MENNIYPIRSFIRFQARQLIANARAEDAPAVRQGDERQGNDVQREGPGAYIPLQTPSAPLHSDTVLDSALLKEISTTLFNSERYPELYRPCKDIIEATAIEDAIALEIVVTYRRIKENQQRAEVQHLNNLL